MYHGLRFRGGFADFFSGMGGVAIGDTPKSRPGDCQKEAQRQDYPLDSGRCGRLNRLGELPKAFRNFCVK